MKECDFLSTPCHEGCQHTPVNCEVCTALGRIREATEWCPTENHGEAMLVCAPHHHALMTRYLERDRQGDVFVRFPKEIR